jgi:DNA-binding NtrC family response regulator
LESELFGYEKGAFTGAAASKKGKLELADGGTVFLDEVGDMTPATQAKLLRFLQEGELEKVGSSGTAKADVRVIAATNKDLAMEIAEKRFRHDLYYRLNELPVRVPALTERREDIPVLARHFLDLFCMESGLPEKSLSDQAVLKLAGLEWKGNVRELKNAIKRLVVLLDRQTIEPQDIDQVLQMEQSAVAEALDEEVSDLRRARDDFERIHIRKVLEKCKGNMTRAAEEMGIERSNLYKKIRQLGMENLVV